MIPWETLDTAPVPGGGELQLARRGDEYVIRVDRKDLMSSRVFGSEEQLAVLACEGREDARVMVGGLGMGFTLAATLKALGPKAHVVVAELVEAVIEWNRGVLAQLAGEPLEDERVEVFQGDVARLIKRPGGTFDVIMLDVDNGPDALTHDSNAWLYKDAGLRAISKALSPNGVLAVWAAFDDPQFTKRLRRAGFDVEVVPVRAPDTRSGWQSGKVEKMMSAGVSRSHTPSYRY